MLEWLIIGGGIHGTALAFYLTHYKNIPHESVRILDPHERLLALWDQFTANTGMDYLRSPKVHNLHHDPWSIRTYAETQQGKPHAQFIPIYDRPSRAFFRKYNDWLIDKYHLSELHIHGRANKLTRIDNGWRVDTDKILIEAKRLVLAIGVSEQPLWTAWGKTLQQQQTPIHHIFEQDFVRDALPEWSQAVIVGGGISAVQTAITMAKQTPATVRLLMPHPVRIAHFDSDPCWVTRLCLEDFHNEQDYAKRRQMIRSARQKGTVPPDVAQELQTAIDDGLLKVDIAVVKSASYDGKNIAIHLENGEIIASDRVILATGFDPKRPGGKLVDDLVADYELPVAECGYPIVDTTLCWADGLYVSGALAELEVGPVARNIIGARLASERIGRAV